MIDIRDTALGATFAVKVHPRAKKNAITGEVGDALKVALTAPPVEGVPPLLLQPARTAGIR